jgi:VWFA-related protein
VPLGLSVAARAQAPATIRAGTRLVLVPATVIDRKGRSIDGLQTSDFELADEGTPRPIRMDTADVIAAPVSLAVLVQASGISAPALAKIHKVGGMIQPLITGDRGRAAVIAFSDEVRVVQEFSGDSQKIRAAFSKIEGGAIYSGRMLDAIAEGVGMLEARPDGQRRVMLVLGESRDRGSTAKLADVIERAQRAAVTIYPTTYSAQKTAWTARPEDDPTLPGGANPIQGIIELVRMGKNNDADALARATGGWHLSFTTLKGLEGVISRAGEEIHSQYLLSFVPEETSNEGFHRIEVRVPSRPEAVVRARPGYWAR